MSWQIELIKRHPLLFRKVESGQASGYPCVGDGWQLIVERAIERIDAAVSQRVRRGHAAVHVAQIKEKLGGLRIYADWNGLPPEIADQVDDAISLAEARSYCTCESCGAFGRLHEDHGWYTTRCDRHASGQAIEQRPDDPDLHIQFVLVDGKMRVARCRRYDRESDSFVDAALPPGETWAEEK